MKQTLEPTHILEENRYSFHSTRYPSLLGRLKVAWSEMFPEHFHLTGNGNQTPDLWILSLSLTLSLGNGVGGSLDSYSSLKPLWSGMDEVVPARTLPTLHSPSCPAVL